MRRLSNPVLQNHILLQMVDFLIAGHICHVTTRPLPLQLLSTPIVLAQSEQLGQRLLLKKRQVSY